MFVCVHSLLTDIVWYVCYVETIYYMVVMLLRCGTGYVILDLPDKLGKCFECSIGLCSKLLLLKFLIEATGQYSEALFLQRLLSLL